MTTGRLAIVLGLAAALLWTTGLAEQEASMLDVGDAEGYLGEWALTLETPRGTQEQNLVLTDVGGVAAELSGGRGGTVTVTDIARSEDDLVLKFERNMRGNSMPVTMTLSLDGDTLKVSQEIGDRFSMTGTGEKQS